MKTIQKALCSICVFLLLLPCIQSIAAGKSYINEARVFYDLGFYNGIALNYFDPDLNSFVDNETAVAFVLKLTGLKNKALTLSDEKTNQILSAYADSDLISDWCRKYYAYAIESKIAANLAGGSLYPKKLVEGRTLAAMQLNYLGYNLTDEYASISAYLHSFVGGMTPADARYWNDKIISKNDMLGITWKALNIKSTGGVKFIDLIISKSNINKDRLINLGFDFASGQTKLPVFPEETSQSGSANSGSYIMKDGSTYVGQTVNGIPNGVGTVQYEAGRYEGQVVGGMRNGEGKLIRNDGFIYSGEWKNDTMTGKGNIQWPNGDSYEGEMWEGVFQGSGTLKWVSGDSYSGQFDKGFFSGYGRFYWNIGNYYEGQWSNGEFNGYGIFRYASGETYEGEWKNGKKNGKGKHIDGEGRITIGTWENDAQIN